MQDIHPIGGRFFGGGGDRRLRPNNHLNGQAMKCPRCDSLNTKFCYYNNYNLSQPRHFCKSCRRYWTKGGVLRNVPVGGGCRKSKRSKTKATPTNPADASQDQKSNSHSSSESSSLTATTTAAAAPPVNTSDATATEVVSAGAASSNLAPTFLNFSESDFFLPQNTNPTFDHQPLIENSTDVRFQDIGSLTSISMIGFNMGEIPAYRLLENQSSNERQWNQTSKMVETFKTNELKMEETGTGFLNETGRVEFNGLQQSRESNNELPPLDWQTGGGDNGLFDLTGTVDQAYWSQTQWGENDHSLNFLP